MRRLLWLYPAAWRRRYGAEMEAFLRQSRPGPREVIDLLRGALDAHLHPQWPDAGGLARTVLLVLAGAVVNTWLVALSYWAPLYRVLGGPPVWLPSQTWFVATAWSALGVVAHVRRWRLVSVFALLVVTQTAAFAVLPLVAGIARSPVLALLAVSAMGRALVLTVVGLVALRQARVSWPVAVAAPLLAALVAERVDPVVLVRLPANPVPGTGAWLLPSLYLESLRVVLWAAVLAALVTRRSRRRGPGRGPEPPEGAPVPERPLPDPPEPLAARRGREH
jgi:hypothetical protein